MRLKNNKPEVWDTGRLKVKDWKKPCHAIMNQEEAGVFGIQSRH